MLPRAAIRRDPLWYKDAVIYEAARPLVLRPQRRRHRRLPGLTQKLDYIQDLGVNTIWLLPFYPSPLRDDGYDIADYANIHPSYGTLRDFDRFLDEAHARGLRVITELVVNHTSDQHPVVPGGAPRAAGLAGARLLRLERHRPASTQGVRIIFTDTEKSNWTWDDDRQGRTSGIASSTISPI